MLKDIKMRFVIQVGINYSTSGGLRSGQIQHSLMQESLGQKLCNSHLPLQNNCPCEPSTFKKEREEILQHYILLQVSFKKKCVATSSGSMSEMSEGEGFEEQTNNSKGSTDLVASC